MFWGKAWELTTHLTMYAQLGDQNRENHWEILKHCFEERANPDFFSDILRVWWSQYSTHDSLCGMSLFSLLMFKIFIISPRIFCIDVCGFARKIWLDIFLRAVNVFLRYTNNSHLSWSTPRLICATDLFVCSSSFSAWGSLSACNKIQDWGLLFIQHLLVVVTHAAAVAWWKIAHQSEMFSLLRIGRHGKAFSILRCKCRKLINMYTHTGAFQSSC